MKGKDAVERRSRLHLGRMRRLSPERQALLETRLPVIRVEVSGNAGTLDPRALCVAPSRTVWLEIGFGAGEHLLYQASRHPENLLIGCEPYVAGIARLLADLETCGGNIDNIRIHDGDAADLLFALETAGIERIFMLFPDPWPKKRHHKRRMARVEMLREMERVLVDNGELRITTDSGAYAGWILANTRRCVDLSWQAECAEDWRVPVETGVETRYEIKARRSGRQVVYLNFVRMPRKKT